MICDELIELLVFVKSSFSSDSKLMSAELKKQLINSEIIVLHPYGELIMIFSHEFNYSIMA